MTTLYPWSMATLLFLFTTIPTQNNMENKDFNTQLEELQQEITTYLRLAVANKGSLGKEHQKNATALKVAYKIIKANLKEDKPDISKSAFVEAVIQWRKNIIKSFNSLKENIKNIYTKYSKSSAAALEKAIELIPSALPNKEIIKQAIKNSKYENSKKSTNLPSIDKNYVVTFSFEPKEPIKDQEYFINMPINIPFAFKKIYDDNGNPIYHAFPNIKESELKSSIDSALEYKGYIAKVEKIKIQLSSISPSFLYLDTNIEILMRVDSAGNSFANQTYKDSSSNITLGGSGGKKDSPFSVGAEYTHTWTEGSGKEKVKEHFGQSEIVKFVIKIDSQYGGQDKKGLFIKTQGSIYNSSEVSLESKNTNKKQSLIDTSSLYNNN